MGSYSGSVAKPRTSSRSSEQKSSTAERGQATTAAASAERWAGSETEADVAQVQSLADSWVGRLLVLLRVAQGLVMARMAYVLAFKGGWDAFGNASSLIPSVVQGPLGNVFTNLYGNQVALWLIILGATAVAISLVSGFLVRLGSAVGALMALSFYLADLPPADGWINLRLLYLVGLALIAAGRTGCRWGVDRWLAGVERRQPWLRWIAG
ncbi:MAG: hypothetical protein IMX01_07515 [Limnochordaceae bacterium]|nr:hypothetical protein [Limnochordaceae bacterium]